MGLVQIHVDSPLTVVPCVGGFEVVTFVGGTQCAPVGVPRFDTEVEARAFILGAEWAEDELEAVLEGED